MSKLSPIALILFSNDMDQFLPMVERERKMIEEAFEHFSDTNRLKVIARSSVSIEEIFRLFNRYRGRIALFHFAGHADGNGLQFNKNFEQADQGQAAGLADLFRQEVSEGILQLVFLNGCSTNPQLERLIDANVPSVISTRHPIEDQKAILFAKQFYHTLANTDHESPFTALPSLQDAFQHALAYLKTADDFTEQQPTRAAKFSVAAKVKEETWTLFSNNPDWRLSTEVAGENKPFNEFLTLHLIDAIQPYSPLARDFRKEAKNQVPTGWETVANISDQAKYIIAYSFVGVLGVQLRKLFAIGIDPLSEDKQRRYLNNCLLTGKRALQLLCFALLSSYWDQQKDRSLRLSPSQHQRLEKFFVTKFELDIQGYIDLLQTLCNIFSDFQLDYPIGELKEFLPQLKAPSDFLKATKRLQELKPRLDNHKFDLSDCFVAERQLTVLLTALNFLAAYKMVSVKNIDYDEMRNSPPRYLHNYTRLGVNIKGHAIGGRVQYAEAPITTDAILLFKGRRYQQNVNLFPFIIDLNALTSENGAKVCFYSYLNLNDGSLIYRFQEDNRTHNIVYQETKKADSNLNRLMMNPEDRKNYKLDFVYLQFQEAKKAILGVTAAEEMKDFDDEDDIMF